MAATVKQDGMENENQVTYEDQQKINKFARVNARLQDVKEELSSKKKELQNLEDAADEMLLQDDDQSIPYQIGEVFVSLSADSANEMLEKSKESTQDGMKLLESKCEDYKKTLQDLKVELYAKFGTNINLEAEEE